LLFFYDVRVQYATAYIDALENAHLENLGIDGRIILTYIIQK